MTFYFGSLIINRQSYVGHSGVDSSGNRQKLLLAPFLPFTGK